MDFFSAALKNIKQRQDDDFTDRLNYYYTCVIILLFSIVVSAKQWVGQPIECWVPAHFTGSWEEYTENYCYIQNTYWLTMNQTIPHDVTLRDHRQIGYYQWVPFILALLAFFFYAPYLIWWMLNWSTGIDIHSIIKMAQDKNDIDSEGHTKHVKIIAGYIRESLRSQRHIGSTHCGGWGCFAVFSHKGCLVTALLIFVKALYVINSICQILLMSAMLGETSAMYGLQVFVDLIRGVEWETTGNFPRVTLCDFETRVLGNVQRHTVQCVLMINMFNEKIFVVLWFWFVLVAAMSIYGFVEWIMYCVDKQKRLLFIHRFVKVQFDPQPDKHDEQFMLIVQKFVDRFLFQDGVLLIRKLSNHAGETIAAHVTIELFRHFQEKHEKLAALGKDHFLEAKKLELEIEGENLHLSRKQTVAEGTNTAPESDTGKSSLSGSKRDLWGFLHTKVKDKEKDVHESNGIQKLESDEEDEKKSNRNDFSMEDRKVRVGMHDGKWSGFKPGAKSVVSKVKAAVGVVIEDQLYK